MNDEKELFVREIDLDVMLGEEEEEASCKRKLDISEFSESDLDASDWEDIPLDGTNDSFNITIANKPDREYLKRKQNIKEIKRKMAKRKSINTMGMITYILHAKRRNEWLNDAIILKTLKKSLPLSLIDGKLKKFRKQLKRYKTLPTEELKSLLDVQLVYLLKYLIKWFRFNFKIDCNGLRVLGYLPDIAKKDVFSYFPKNSLPIPDVQTFKKIVKKFKHNRDSGAQIFTALLRSIGLESRLVFSIPQISINSNATQPKFDSIGTQQNKDFDLLYPYFWTELINPIDEDEIFLLETIAFHDEEKRIIRLKRTGKVANNNIKEFYTDTYFPKISPFNMMSMHYVISISPKGTIIEVSSRYMTDISYRWFNKLDLRTNTGKMSLLIQSIIRILNCNNNYNNYEIKELDMLRCLGLKNFIIPNNITSLRRSPNFTPSNLLRYNEVIKPGAKPIGFVLVGNDRINFYSKEDLLIGKSEQQWKFLGRSVKNEEIDNCLKETTSIIPKMISRRKTYNHDLAMSIQKKTKLYSFMQTCPYIKDKVINNILPKNKYGNIEIYRNHMVPDGCIWLKLKDIEYILNLYSNGKLGIFLKEKIQFTPVVTGFDFRTKVGSAVPIKHGVIVLKNQFIIIYRIWMYGRNKLKKTELEKKELVSLFKWNYILKSLKIKSRIEDTYS